MSDSDGGTAGAIDREVGSRPVAVPEPLSPAYARYVLAICFCLTAVNIMDRQVMSVVVGDLKLEFGVSDFQIGLLAGTVFAVFHALAGIPIARIGDKSNRRNLIVAGLVVWSGLTALTAVAWSYVQVFVLRMGVGIGESVGSGPMHSMLSDYFPAARRGVTLAIVGAGGTLGSLLGFALGGWLVDHYGWRTTFVVFGTPGLLLASLMLFTIREPVRGAADGVVVSKELPPIMEVFRYLGGLRSYRHIVLFNSTNALATYALVFWIVAFLERTHGLDTAQAGAILAVTMSLSSVIGGIAAGRLADRLGLRDLRWYLGVPAIASLVAGLCVQGFLHSSGLVVALAFLVPAALCNMAWLGTSNALVQGLAQPRMRAVASQILLVFNAILGLGIGPALAGYLSDLWSPEYGTNALRYALSVCTLFYLGSTVHAMLAMRTLKCDVMRARTG